MSGKKRVNPNRQPVTMADVERAYKDGYEEGYYNCTIQFLTVLYDKEQANAEVMLRVHNELESLKEGIDKKYVTIPQLAKMLSTDYSTVVTKN